MISTDRDSGPCGKGDAAEKGYVAHTVLFGRDENIGATVTAEAVVSYYDRTTCALLLTAAFSAVFLFNNNHTKGEKVWKVLYGHSCPLSSRSYSRS